MNRQPWYQNGLRFECQQCGNCCSGSPGHVWVNDEEIAAIAGHLGIDEADFRQCYTISMQDQGTRLAERQNDDCIFYNRSHGCVIYEHRPRQCRTWPFWKSNLASDQTWLNTAKTCPGANRGRPYGIEEIAAYLEDDGLR